MESKDITEYFKTNFIENEGIIKKWISIHAFDITPHIYFRFLGTAGFNLVLT